MSVERAPSIQRPGVVACANCGAPCEPFEEYGLEVAEEEVTFVAHRCPACYREYVNAPEILREDTDLVHSWDPNASPLGTYRRLVNLTSRDREFRHHAGDNVAGTLLWYLLEEDLADVVFLAHQSVTETPVMAFTKRDLFEAGQIRMGAGRAIVTGGGLRTNLLTLTQLKNFATTDRGLHPRVAVMGRPCQIYTVRKLRWDRFLPSYDLVFALGTFCYGNFAPARSGGERLRALLGFEPSAIRQVRFLGEGLEFTASDGRTRVVGQDDVAGLVNANCLQCYDFSVSFSDVSVGHVGGEELFECALIRTDAGERAVDAAVAAGFLAPAIQLYGKVDASEEETRASAFLNAMVEIKRELTRRIR